MFLLNNNSIKIQQKTASKFSISKKLKNKQHQNLVDVLAE
jgi:hypothetical protein